MRSAVIDQTKKLIQQYFMDWYGLGDTELLNAGLFKLCGEEAHSNFERNPNGKQKCEDLQAVLSTINEKEETRKANGVYYTPSDVVRFITANCIRATYGLSQMIFR
jgi:hypothetical protein